MLKTLLSRLPFLTACTSLVLVGALAGACDSGDGDSGDSDGSETGELPEVDCAASNVPAFGELAAISSCTSCHSSELSGGDRAGAPVGVDYDTYENAKANAEQGAVEVNAGRMPIGSSLGESDKEDFYLWALCGTPQ